ncbi:MAG TPA: XrtA/PEP-CTERM system exopolysaccharide export protein [Gammaproteobacteria bacterium]|nr:XrtA/PEP-CTERM system exopolysaccharide export protein [Gammaproteobacteria bacterium]
MSDPGSSDRFPVTLTVRLLATALLVSGCAATGLSQPAPAGAGAPAAGAPAGSPSAPNASTDYLIGAGDTLQVFVWRQPDLSVTVPVRPDGRISTPLIEDLVAVGKTPTQLSHEIEKALSEFVRSPEVNVIVQKFVGTFGDQIRVLGQAAQPKSLPYRDGLTLLDVMIEVGGLTQFAAGNRSHVVRTEGGKSKKIHVKLNDLVNRGKIDENIKMKPGDVVIIPEAVF